MALAAAAIVLVIINFLIIYSFEPDENWRRWLPLGDLFSWAAIFVTVVFNRLVNNSSVEPKDKSD
jgi:hypothetical protein